MAILGKPKNYQEEAEEYLVDGEEIITVRGLILDFVCLTNKRVFFVDKKFTSSATALISIPYEKIDAIAIEKGKTFSLTNEIEIMTKGKEFELKFIKGEDVVGFYKQLTKLVCA